MAYDLYPAVDATYNFPPEVRAALAASLDLRNTVIPMTTTQRNNLTGTALWDGRLILNTTTDRINRYDLGTTSWNQITEASELQTERTLQGMRNRIHNGDFRVNQRSYVSAAALAVGAYGFDRWKSMIAATTLTFTAALNGQLVTMNTNGQIAQVIERADISAGRYVLSHAGTALARVYNSGAGAPAFAATPLMVDLTGTTDVIVEFQANGATKTVGNVQLEQIGVAGAVADVTPFEERPYGLELILCLRFYERFVSGGVNHGMFMGQATSTTSSQVMVNFTVPKRATPTFGTSGAGGFYAEAANGGGQTLNAIALVEAGPGQATLGTSCAAVLAAGSASIFGAGGAASWIDFSADL